MNSPHRHGVRLVTATLALLVSLPLAARADVDWTKATAASRIGGSHPVFKVTVPGAVWIVKDPDALQKADEAFFSQLATDAGLVAPTVRFPGEDEKAKCVAAIKRLETRHGDAERARCTMVMNNLEGTDFTELGNQLRARLTDARLQDLGKLLAFQLLMVGHDRFQLPNQIPGMGNQSRNPDNVRFAAAGDRVQAIDNSVDSGTLTGNNFARYQAAVGNALEESIFATDGSDRLSQAVRAFIQTANYDVGDAGARNVRTGILAAITQIGAIAPNRIRELSTAVQNAAGRAGSVVGVQTPLLNLTRLVELFRNKAQVVQAVQAVQNPSAQVMAVMLGVARIRLGITLDGALLTLLEGFNRNPLQRMGGVLGRKTRQRDWTESLLQVRVGKKEVTDIKRNNRNITQQQVDGILEDVRSEGLPTLAAVNDAERREDFTRLGAKIILRIQFLYERDRVQ